MSRSLIASSSDGLSSVRADLSSVGLCVDILLCRRSCEVGCAVPGGLSGTSVSLGLAGWTSAFDPSGLPASGQELSGTAVLELDNFRSRSWLEALNTTVFMPLCAWLASTLTSGSLLDARRAPEITASTSSLPGLRILVLRLGSV